MEQKAQAQLLLASGSPRRRELLEQIGVRFGVIRHEVDETPRTAEVPEDYVRRMAEEKASSGAALCGAQNPVLGADTAVIRDDAILGKPRDREHALSMLRSLSGRTHRVCSAVSLSIAGRLQTRLSVTTVRFRDLEERELEAYWRTGEPTGKAGAYAIQGIAAVFVSSIEGSYTGVVGLPLAETAELLRAAGVATALEREDMV